MTNLTDLTNNRKKLVEQLRKNNDKSHEILAEQLYNKPTQFITELLQNAEDEGAKNIEFHLTKNELIFTHDANRLFDFKDIRAISNFGDNKEKKEKPNAIGRFGIGFKSVYSITNTPRIISGNFDVTINDYIIPEHNNDHSFYNGTKIILPFNHKEKLKNEIYDLIKNEIQDLSLEYLLFLSNIETIEWSVGSQTGYYKKTKQLFDKEFPHFSHYSLHSENRLKNYYLLNRGVEIDQKTLSLKIAFQVEDDKIQPVESSPLYAFFPTAQETALNFLLHAPYLTTPARDNIENDSRNDLLTKELGILLSENLVIFKQLGLLNIDLLETLPINKHNCSRSKIYSILYESVKTKLNSEKQLIPTSDGEYTSAKKAMLSGSGYLIELINKKQRELLFDRRDWVDTDITADKTKELKDYLFSELEIPEHNLTSFARHLDLDFISKQSDDWLIHFYSVIHSAAPRLWEAPKSRYKKPGILRSKPIIRTENDKQVVPFKEDGKPNVYLPSHTTNYPTVKRSITNNKKAQEFLKDFGLTTPDLFDEINEFILPSFKDDKIPSDYYLHIKKIITALDSQGKSEKRSRLIKDLRTYPFIKSQNNESGESRLKKYDEVYFLTEELEVYFDGISTFFVSMQAFPFPKNLINKLKSIFKEVGVKNYPIRRKIPSYLTSDEKKELRADSYNGKITSENHCIDYKLDGLTHFLQQPLNQEKSIILWNFLLKFISEKNSERTYFNKYPGQGLFKGSYSWKYRKTFNKSFDAYFYKQLKSTPWLILDNEKSYLPSHLTLSDLSDGYQIDNEEAEILAGILGFKPDDVQKIEEKYGGKFISKEEYEELEKLRKWKSQQEKPDELEDESEFNPEVKPDEIPTVISELKSQETDFNDYSKNAQQNNNDTDKTSSPKSSDKEENKRNSNPKRDKDIGDWGENYVEIKLVEEFGKQNDVEIINLNESGTTGVGCDFLVKQKQQIIRLIEVKSTTKKFGKTLTVSGNQWETARSYFKINDGNKFWIYCVCNAGRKNAEIVRVQNPIKKWKEGKLFAHPVEFVIK